MKKIKINLYDVVYVPFFKDIKRVTVLQINRSTFIGLDDLGEKEVFIMTDFFKISPPKARIIFLISLFVPLVRWVLVWF